MRYYLSVLCNYFFAEQFCEVFRIAGIGYVMALIGAEVLVVVDAVGSVKW